MSSAAIQGLCFIYPNATIDVIAKKGLTEIAATINGINQIYEYDRNDFSGITGNYKFGKQIAKNRIYDLYVSLPNSISTAVTGIGVGATHRIGYKKELRSILLTHSYPIPALKHRVDEYCTLIENYSKSTFERQVSIITSSDKKQSNHIVLNFNSEADSRRIPVKMAQHIIDHLLEHVGESLILIGAPNEIDHNNKILENYKQNKRVKSQVGKTNFGQLINLMKSADFVITSDSGPAHLSNYLNTKTIVLFGAGNENNTSPYNKKYLKVIRAKSIDCAPCVSNNCKFNDVHCLTQISINTISETINNWKN
jgi:ADP-heptose:LPS heptosyltransferase